MVTDPHRPPARPPQTGGEYNTLRRSLARSVITLTKVQLNYS